MGQKGAKLSQEAADASQRTVQTLAPLGDVSSRKMFGGYGIFEGDTMFALINSEGEVYLKVDDSNRERFEQAGASKHGRMPYFQIPPDVWADEDTLRDWAQVSIEIAHSSKKK